MRGPRLSDSEHRARCPRRYPHDPAFRSVARCGPQCRLFDSRPAVVGAGCAHRGGGGCEPDGQRRGRSSDDGRAVGHALRPLDRRLPGVRVLPRRASRAHTTTRRGRPSRPTAVGRSRPTPCSTPYKTRIQVYRPIDPGELQRHGHVEWLNVTNQSDSAADWILAHNEIDPPRRGLRRRDRSGDRCERGPEPRARALRKRRREPRAPRRQLLVRHLLAGRAGGPRQPGDVLGGLALAQLIALGESQSATRLVTYIDALGILHAGIRRLLVHSRGTNGAALRAAIPPGTINDAGPTLIRTDLGVPVFVLQTETDTRATRQPDTVRLPAVGSRRAARTRTCTRSGSDSSTPARTTPPRFASSRRCSTRRTIRFRGFCLRVVCP